VRLVLTSAGASFLGAVNQGRAYVRIAPHEERLLSAGRLWHALKAGDPMSAFRGNYAQRDVMQDMRKRLAKYKDLRVAIRNQQSFNIGGGNWDIDFSLRGPDLDVLLRYAEELRTQALAAGGFADLDTTLRLNKPELHVEIDRDRAADLGIDPEDIASAMRLMVGGDTEVTRYRDPEINDDYDVQLRLSEGDRDTADKLARLHLPGRNGQLVRLDSIATVTPALGPSRIDRLDRQRQVSIRGGVAPGYALADRLKVLEQKAAALNMPPGYSTMVAGRGRELARTYKEFGLAFLLSIVFMYMILGAQFDSYLHPLTILLSLPLALPFALFSLWVTNDTLNMYSALGILVLFGIVKKNSILQVDHINQLRETGSEREVAVVQASRDRLRPILMTTLSFVAGMMPLVLGTGPGAEERRTIAIVIVGGQVLALVLTLLVTPVAYMLLEDGVALLRRALGMKQRKSGTEKLLISSAPG
jgi:HAE1 family hydrophobic/amphiphilic exporter-1